MRRNLVASTLLALALGSSVLVTADAAHATHPGTSSHSTAQKAGSYRVTAKVNKLEPLEGEKVKIKGSVSPAAVGQTVKLQVKYEGRKSWKTIDSGKLNGASKFSFKDKVNSVRYRTYRVVKPAGAGRAAGHGGTQRVTVFGWRDLTTLTPVAAVGAFETASATINTVTYPNSIKSVGTAAGHIDYNLNRDCKMLDANFGIDDTSPLGSSAGISVVADGVTKSAGNYGLAQSQFVFADVSNVFRLVINTAPAGGGIAAVGTPRVLCSF